MQTQKLLGMKFRNPDESIIQMGYDIIERGMVPKGKNYKGQPHFPKN